MKSRCCWLSREIRKSILLVCSFHRRGRRLPNQIRWAVRIVSLVCVEIYGAFTFLSINWFPLLFHHHSSPFCTSILKPDLRWFCFVLCVGGGREMREKNKRMNKLLHIRCTNQKISAREITQKNNFFVFNSTYKRLQHSMMSKNNFYLKHSLWETSFLWQLL